MTAPSWVSTLTPITKYRLWSSLITKAALNGNDAYSIERIASALGSDAILTTAIGTPNDWPIPSLDLTTRPQPAEVVQYADFSQRAQGPWNFTWGFRAMLPLVFNTYMLRFGFYGWTGSPTNAFNDTGVWSLSTVTVQTLDMNVRIGTAGSEDAYQYYRCFQGTVLRPVPGRDFRIGAGGAYENVLFRFVGLTEITS